LAAVWALLEKYSDWLTSAPRTADATAVQALEVRPVLVLTGDSDAQEKIFYDRVPVGGRLLVFGAVHTNTEDPMAAPAVLESEQASNYRRWWNNPWSVAERGGQSRAGDWTAAGNDRLRELVKHAHSQGLWVRFYTLDGATAEELSCHGWFRNYNFGSFAAARLRWQAAYAAGVDYIASDQYEQLAAYLKELKRSPGATTRAGTP
jgi:glycerophosphoryl diester phosphodiesterase